jgi:hypothetical protein
LGLLHSFSQIVISGDQKGYGSRTVPGYPDQIKPELKVYAFLLPVEGNPAETHLYILQQADRLVLVREQRVLRSVVPVNPQDLETRMLSGAL